jgi:hypothetical protein
MTVISLVEEINELELKIAASSAVDKKIVALHVQRLNAAASLTSVPSANIRGADQMFDDDLMFDNVPV